jgi:hypothetical protein
MKPTRVTQDWLLKLEGLGDLPVKLVTRRDSEFEAVDSQSLNKGFPRLRDDEETRKKVSNLARVSQD